jgi:hypothetical protein
VGVSRLRWGLGATLIVLSLASVARALVAYAGHRLWLGSAAVLLLGAIAIAGFASLWRARRRIAVELDGLAADPPRGALLDERRARLEAIRASGATPDREALAAATEAEERGQAYLGRYLVAVTVMVGLVGTFAGLMETLRTVGPLLHDERVSTLQMIAAPLDGLDVTFGASIVGILVTLALALVQGDLVIAEELALARLEERTTHWLVPSLWPPSEAAGERAARELAELRVELGRALAGAGRALGDAGEATAARVGAAAAREVDRLGARVDEALDRVFGATDRLLSRSDAHVDNATEKLLTAVQSLLDKVAAQTTATLEGVAGRVDAAVGELSAQATQALAQVAASTTPLTDGAGELRAGAEALRAAADTLAPQLASLGPELAALAREVALVAARTDGERELPIADELVRLGDGIDRLEALLRLGAPRQDGGAGGAVSVAQPDEPNA